MKQLRFLVPLKGTVSCYILTIEYIRIRQKGKQRSSLLDGGRTWMPLYSHLVARMIWRIFFKSIHFGRLAVWCGVNLMIIHIFKASIRPSIRSSIQPFFQIILALNCYSAAWNWSIPSPNQQTRPSIWFLLYFHSFLQKTLSGSQVTGFNSFEYAATDSAHRF